jgi:hypothetical protein
MKFFGYIWDGYFVMQFKEQRCKPSQVVKREARVIPCNIALIVALRSIHLTLLASIRSSHERAITGDHLDERGVFGCKLPQDCRYRTPADLKLGCDVVHRRQLGGWRVGAIGNPLAQGAFDPRRR